MTTSGTPIPLTARRYAEALFDLGEEAGVTDALLEDLSRFSALIASNDDIKTLVRHPLLSNHDKSAAVKAVAEKANLNGLTVNFLALVAMKGRLIAVDDIITGFRQCVALARGEVVAEVSSAAKLSEEQLAALTTALNEKLGKSVQISQKIDGSLLGGLVVKVGSRMIDTSVKTKLQNLKLAMREVG